MLYYFIIKHSTSLIQYLQINLKKLKIISTYKFVKAIHKILLSNLILTIITFENDNVNHQHTEVATSIR